MKYECFEQLPVWQAAQDLALRIFAFTDRRELKNSGDLRDQLRRASLSVSNNIAEGFERGSTSELLMFIYIARGSAGEVRSMLRFCEQWPPTASLKSEISDLICRAESCSRQLRAWADSLQNSDIRGQRHLNEQTRKAYEYKHRAGDFLKRLEEVQDRNRRGAADGAPCADRGQDADETAQHG
jgi:four helix bundle protein